MIILFTWTTSSEQQNKGFEIQRSHDGKQWAEIGLVSDKSKTGNSSQAIDYTFTVMTALN